MELLRKLYVFIRRKYRVFNKKKIVLLENEKLENTPFVIIADNCWGGSVYQWYDRPYNSPFVGLAIYGDCYIKLVSKFDYYMSKKLVFQNTSKYLFTGRLLNYPLGLLDDIEIHFVHYKNPEEAQEKWNRRKERMLKESNKDNYFFKMCDEWKAENEMLEKFHQLPIKNKITFAQGDKEIVSGSNHIKIKERHKRFKNTVPNGVKLFKISFLYFDLTEWLLSSKMKRTTFRK